MMATEKWCSLNLFSFSALAKFIILSVVRVFDLLVVCIHLHVC